MALHGKGNGHPGRDGVQPQLIAEIVGIDDDVIVVIPAHRSEGVGGLVFGAFQTAAIRLGLDFADPRATDRTGKAADLFHHPTLVQSLGRDAVDKGDLDKLMVLGRQIARHVLGPDQEGGTLFDQARRPGISHQTSRGFGAQAAKGRRHPEALCGSNVNRLQVLGAHHGATAGPGGGAAIIIYDCRQGYLVLPGHSDASDAAASRGRVQQVVVHGRGRLSPKVFGRNDAYLVIRDLQIHRAFGPAADHEGVEPGPAQFRAKVPTRVSIAVGPGQR